MYKLWLLPLLIATLASASTAQNSNVDSSNRIVTQEVQIGGTSTLDTQQLQEIANSLTALRVSPDDEELRQRIRDAFQQRGYFDADVTGLKVVPLDPLAKPKPVRIEAEVSEGPHFRLSDVRFVGNTALSADELRQLVPLRTGEFFGTAKVRSGFEAMRKRYLTLGYLDWMVVPSTDKAGSALVALTIDITERPQYLMGALEIEGKSDAARLLRSLWQLERGQPFDAFYPHEFLEESKSLLSVGFQPSRDLYTLRDCSDFTVLVHINLDPNNTSYPAKRDKPCEKANEPTKAQD